MKKTNIERLQDVAEALDELNERVVGQEVLSLTPDPSPKERGVL